MRKTGFSLGKPRRRDVLRAGMYGIGVGAALRVPPL